MYLHTMTVDAFVDPRTEAKVSAPKPLPRTTADPRALAELHRLCREGRLYDVEHWIRSGLPLQSARGTRVKGRHLASALEIALESRNHALVLLLLCNGYDQGLEVNSPLDIALRARRWDLVDILLEWGADPHQVNLSDLFATYRTDLLERFSTLGVDLTAGHALAETLAYHTSNKPLFGFARRHREHDPVGARWVTSSPEEIASVRRSLLRMSEHVFVDVVKLFATGDYVSSEILQALGRTPRIREQMKKVGFIPLPPEDSRSLSQSRPTRSREVLLKFGIEVKELCAPHRKAAGNKAEKATTPHLPRSVTIGLPNQYGREIRLNRAALFERVWSEPVETLAKAWGLSGRGLAKACHRLQIPVPPRGFWAKLQHGGKRTRRPRLPVLQPGEAEEIVIHAPALDESGES